MQNEFEMVLVIGIILLVPVYLLGYFMSAVTGFNLARDGAKQDLFLKHQLIERYLVIADQKYLIMIFQSDVLFFVSPGRSACSGSDEA